MTTKTTSLEDQVVNLTKLIKRLSTHKGKGPRDNKANEQI